MSLLQDAETDMVTIKLAAAVVVHPDYDFPDRDRVLLVRRSFTEKFLPGSWGVPCGKLEPHESPGVGALRELFEETNLKGELVKMVGQSEFGSIFRNRRTLNIQYNYLVRVNPSGRGRNGMPKVHLPKTDQLSRWVLLSKIDEFGLDEHNQGVIKQVMASDCLRPARSSHRPWSLQRH